MKKDIPYVYCICRIDSKLWPNINKELKQMGYTDIKCFVPVVRILKKSKNNKDHYSETPMLFNYGFVKMRANKAYDRNFLFKLSREIPGIINFVKSLDTMHKKTRKKLRIDNPEDFDDFSKVATISRAQFRHYKRLQRANKIYNLSDILPKVGEFVTLRKYPFEGLLAKVIDFNFSNQTIRVEIYPGNNSTLSLQLPFENVLYSVYDDFNEDANFISDDSRIDINNIPDSETPLDDMGV